MRFIAMIFCFWVGSLPAQDSVVNFQLYLGSKVMDLERVDLSWYLDGDTVDVEVINNQIHYPNFKKYSSIRLLLNYKKYNLMVSLKMGDNYQFEFCGEKKLLIVCIDKKARYRNYGNLSKKPKYAYFTACGIYPYSKVKDLSFRMNTLFTPVW
jgi:hypothetical protein